MVGICDFEPLCSALLCGMSKGGCVYGVNEEEDGEGGGGAVVIIKKRAAVPV